LNDARNERENTGGFKASTIISKDGNYRIIKE